MNRYRSAFALVLCRAASGALAHEPAHLHPGPPATSPPISYHHASTYEEGVLRGRADLSRAVGEQNYNRALANLYHQEAFRRGFYNRRESVQAYFDVKEINRGYRAKYRRAPPTPEQLRKWNAAEIPPRLSALEYHDATGTPTWPALLRDNLFEPERIAIEDVLSKRTADNCGPGTPTHREIKALSTQIESKIRKLGSQIGSAERIAAHKFLKSLAYESRFPAAIDPSELAAKR